MPKVRSETAKARVRESMKVYAASVQKAKGGDSEIAALEEAFKKFDGDPSDLPWNDGSTPPEPEAEKRQGGYAYDRCPGIKQPPSESAGAEAKCAECGYWFKAKKDGKPWPHKKEKANA